MYKLTNKKSVNTRCKQAVAVALALLLGGCGTDDGESAAKTGTNPWLDSSLAPERRAQLLLDAMSLAQKQQQLVGNTPEIVPELPECYGARHVRGIAELGVPTLRITNGPVGIGQNDCVDADLVNDPDRPFAAYTDASSAKATALPSSMATAASFDPLVAAEFGHVIADEAIALALQVYEAPGINLARNPVLGRNFEYKGEDPYLAGIMGVAEVKTVQSRGVIAMAKHFAANEQETNRMNIAQTIDEQVLHELYLLPFEMAVKDGEVASLMCSYNDVNGKQACENDNLLTKVLRDQWGFNGYVQSDFFAVKSTAPSLTAGLDHLMPIPSHWAPDKLNAALAAGDISVSHIDTALERRYTQMFKLGIFERPLVQTPIDVDKGGVAARKIGGQSGVLLQNNGALPFAKDVQQVVVIGKATQVYAQQAVAGGVVVGKPMGAGGGSSDVVPHYTVAPVAGLQNVLNSLGNTSAQVSLLLVEDDNSNLDAAKAAAVAADAVIIMAGTIAEEGADRATFADEKGVNAATAIGDNLDWYTPAPNQITSLTRSDGKPLNPEKNSHTVAMIRGIMAAAPNMAQKTALVLKDNAGVAMPADELILGPRGPAILEVWFPGQEDGHIVADLLFGVVNPSAKLPVTFPVEGRGFLDYIAADPVYFPGVPVAGKGNVEYKEKLNIGYRWYDANVSGQCELRADQSNPCVAFPFGHGLSYTSFELAAPSITLEDGKYVVKTSVKNTGDREGSEVVQVYLGIPAAGQPPKRLVGFHKVRLAPGAVKDVSIVIDPAASNHPLGVYDPALQRFINPAGTYQVYVGTSSSEKDLATISFSRAAEQEGAVTP
ncbi:glycosyl hydrolase [Pseudomaricurvus alcaniphilus]|uniref:beta-glucosidase family protein n=1 Tax=Pseudomaricurvus alcaniphilus TaxID=1166482 RepID=UPI0014080E20|nr:glycoside hydrolase family 3 N-terminal domain-containing protein [Pseudomaricurvus alcaniphilus]NHN35788.1 glycosyl hydrolase [Pseudomaricurvus alcaniphilus]